MDLVVCIFSKDFYFFKLLLYCLFFFFCTLGKLVYETCRMMVIYFPHFDGKSNIFLSSTI